MKLIAMIASGLIATSGVMLGFERSAAKGAAARNDGTLAKYTVDPGHSSVVFGVNHLGASRFYGRFNKATGEFSYNESDPTQSQFDIEIDASTVDTASEGRNSHLKGPDFFNVKQFPTIKFKSQSLKSKGSKSWLLTGDLTLHGVTKKIQATFEWVGTGEFRGQKKGGFEAKFKIKRSDYGMNFMQDVLGDTVKIIVSLEGNLQ